MVRWRVEIPALNLVIIQFLIMLLNIYGQNDLINNQTIYLEDGWNMFSSYILTENMNSEPPPIMM